METIGLFAILADCSCDPNSPVATNGALEVEQTVTMPVAKTWKEGVARLVNRHPFSDFLAWGVRTFVPRQRVGVALVAFNTDEEVLLLRHVFHTAAPWGLPGGWLARDESPVAGLTRELREETALEALVGPVVCVGHEARPPHIVLAFLGWVGPGTMTFSGEILDGRWFQLQDLPQPLWPFTERAITAALPLFRATPHPHLVQESFSA